MPSPNGRTMVVVSIGVSSLTAILRNKNAQTKFVEWFGSAAGVIGALLLASNTNWSGYGWSAFLASNIAWIAYASIKGIRSMLLMQLVFTTTSLIGIYRWLV